MKKQKAAGGKTWTDVEIMAESYAKEAEGKFLQFVSEWLVGQATKKDTLCQRDAEAFMRSPRFLRVLLDVGRAGFCQSVAASLAAGIFRGEGEDGEVLISRLRELGLVQRARGGHGRKP